MTRISDIGLIDYLLSSNFIWLSCHVSLYSAKRRNLLRLWRMGNFYRWGITSNWGKLKGHSLPCFPTKLVICFISVFSSSYSFPAIFCVLSIMVILPGLIPAKVFCSCHSEFLCDWKDSNASLLFRSAEETLRSPLCRSFVTVWLMAGGYAFARLYPAAEA